MCGIAGIYSFRGDAEAVSTDELILLRDAMATRGPDGTGLWLDDARRIGLAHRRLSIIDLSDRAAQPFVSDDGRFVLVFNGEIYNFRALRAELEREGERFRTESDTEVLLKMFAGRGERMLPRLRGMFACAVWDSREQRLFLARDAFGIKPLYYATAGGTLRFASQVKALLRSPSVERRPDAAGHLGFFLLGSVPEPHTLYASIRAVPAGTGVWVDDHGAQEPRSYFSYGQCYGARQPRGADGVEAATRAALRDSVRNHLVADVPVGIFLSAGIDSGALLGLARDEGATDMVAITLAFDEFTGTANDEAPLAGCVARHYGARHVVRRITRAEFAHDLPRILQDMDQPSIDGLNTWFVSKAAKEAGVKVAISGLGGDELFGGYPSFRRIPASVRWLALQRRFLGGDRLLRMATAFASRRLGLGPKWTAITEFGDTYPGAWLLQRALFMPGEHGALLPPELVREGWEQLDIDRRLRESLEPDPGNPQGRVAALETSWYMRNQLLRDTDWASMAHSIEVRVPLVDPFLLSDLAPYLPLHGGKRQLALAPSRPLPDAVARRRKTGFATPIAGWLQQDPALSSWRSQPALSGPHCAWARRWAWEVYHRFQEAA